MLPDDPNLDKSTRRLPTTPGHQTAMLLREKYVRRRTAIQRFTERLQRGDPADHAEIQTLRDVGVSEDEIKVLVAQYSA